jgi:hypothetical protein
MNNMSTLDCMASLLLWEGLQPRSSVQYQAVGAEAPPTRAEFLGVGA